MPGRPAVDGWLLSLCAGRVLMNFVFMSYAACLPVLRDEWSMSATAAGSISTAFQFGYAVSLMGFSALADRAGARRVFLLSGILSAGAALVFALGARSYTTGLVLYTLVALSMGGTYTTAVMLLADRYPTERRGAAVGWLIASSSFGYALALVIAGAVLPRGGYRLAFLATSAGATIGLVIAWLGLRTTPNLVHPRRRDPQFASEVLKNPRAMRLILGYTSHNWELLGMWAWAPAFLTASLGASGAPGLRAVALAAYVTASFHVMGLLASSTMGRLSDRLGRRSVLVAMAAISTACSFAFGWLYAWPPAVVVGVGALYGFTALGDSPVLTTALTEAVKPAYLGAALALRSFVGFGAGAIAPLVFGMVLDATNSGSATPTTWGWAFAALGVGGVVATLCAYTLTPTTGRLDRDSTR